VGPRPQGGESDGQPGEKAVTIKNGFTSGLAADAGPAAERDAGVVCRRLTKDFGSRRVLHEVSFAAPMAAVTGFVGMNGAGKTTAGKWPVYCLVSCWAMPETGRGRAALRRRSGT
jgi:ABC-type multidrug transport system fused ATPase/permease subunit